MYIKSIVCFFVFILLSVIWLFFFQLTDYVPVVRIINKGEQSLVYDDSLLSPEHLDAICTIFSQYGVFYKRKENAVLITRRLYWNMDLMQNYTHKAIYLTTIKQE